MKFISREESKEKNLKYYFLGKSCRNGHFCERYTSNGQCIECNKKYRKYTEQAKKYHKDYYQTNKKEIEKRKRTWYEKNKEKVLELKKKRKEENPIRHMLINVKYSARKLGREFNLLETDIIIPEYCPYLGIKLEFGNDINYPNTPSLDRIDNNKGYVKDNVIVVSRRANELKRDATLNELDLLVNNLRKIVENQFVDYGAYI